MLSSTDNQITLRDGRKLGYALYGDPQGKPIFYFHGFPGSRLEAQLAKPYLTQFHAQLIAPDRPGYGLSDFQHHRSLGDWPGDVLQLADALRLDHFAVLGVSGGGPYAAACALKIPERITAVVTVCGMGPVDGPDGLKGMLPFSRAMLFLSRRSPLLARMIYTIIGRGIRRNPRRWVDRLARIVSDRDKKILARPEIRDVLGESFREAVRSGSRGVAWDVVLYSRCWEFRLEDISKPVYLWHGEGDTIVPVSLGRQAAGKIPHCRASFCPNEGHFSILEFCAEEVFGVLTA